MFKMYETCSVVIEEAVFKIPELSILGQFFYFNCCALLPSKIIFTLVHCINIVYTHRINAFIYLLIVQ